MKASWICAALLALTCTLRQGSAQNVPCFTSLRCNDATGGVGNLARITDCCGMIDTLTYRPTEDSESCLSCYAFGWVTNIADDLSRAEVQPDILMASEGQTITLTLFMVKNIPPNTIRFNFVIESSGSATEGDDYTITPESTFPTLPADIVFSRVPVQVNVTLLNDGVAGEGQEDVRITLVQETVSTPIEENRVLIRDSVLITFQDNDIMSGFSVDAITITEGGVERVCLQTVGTPATDSVLTVAVVFGTAGPTDFNLITTTITPTITTPCVDFEALTDNLGLEDQETVTLVLSGPSNVQLTSPNLTITIEDADIVEFGFFATEVEGDEGSGEIIVTITRSVATALPMSFTLTPIEYNVSYGLDKPVSDPRSPNRATAGADFPTDVIQFTILPGSDSVVVSVPINDDNIAEDSEQCFIGILRFQGFDAGATLGTDVTQLGILDDESAKIQFESIFLSFDEGDVDITYSVNITRDIESEQTYSVGLSSSPRTAGVEDYSVPVGPYDFPPDVSTITVPVTITGDTRIEWGERFDITLSQEGGPPFDMLGDVRTTTTIGINDNDGDYMYVPEQAIYDVTEGEQTQVSFVLLNPPPDGVFEFDFSITLSTADGSAIEGADYMGVVGEVIQASRMPNGTVTTTVAALDDDVVEAEERFAVMGQVTPTGFPVVFNSAASVAIIDNESVQSDSVSFNYLLLLPLVLVLAIATAITAVVVVYCFFRRRKNKQKENFITPQIQCLNPLTIDDNHYDTPTTTFKGGDTQFKCDDEQRMKRRTKAPVPLYDTPTTSMDKGDPQLKGDDEQRMRKTKKAPASLPRMDQHTRERVSSQSHRTEPRRVADDEDRTEMAVRVGIALPKLETDPAPEVKPNVASGCVQILDPDYANPRQLFEQQRATRRNVLLPSEIQAFEAYAITTL